MTGLVVVTVGTDHHRFDRLIDWADAAAVRHPRHRFLVQHGHSRAPVIAEGVSFLPHEELLAHLGTATVVVCHGGPGTIMDARQLGHRPLCVPRDPELGEHVDGHQQRFADLVEPLGLVRTARHAAPFSRLLEDALRNPVVAPDPAADPGRDAVEQARRLLASELDSLLRRDGTRRGGWPRRSRSRV